MNDLFAEEQDLEFQLDELLSDLDTIKDEIALVEMDLEKVRAQIAEEEE